MGNRYIYGGKPALVQSASGTKGVLIRTFNGEIRFRVYQEEGRFIDFEIGHDDLSVTIDEQEQAAFYRVGGHNILDHDPEVLGLERVKDQ